MQTSRAIVWPLVVAAVATTVPASAQMTLDDILGGGGAQGTLLETLIDAASEYPLGSEENPVRADMPEGQRAYLDSLRCEDGKTPTYKRTGNLGVGVFGRIVDKYEVECEGSAPAKTDIIMDMYHPGYQESEPVEGFEIEGDEPSLVT